MKRQGMLWEGIVKQRDKRLQTRSRAVKTKRKERGGELQGENEGESEGEGE